MSLTTTTAFAGLGADSDFDDPPEVQDVQDDQDNTGETKDNNDNSKGIQTISQSQALLECVLSKVQEGDNDIHNYLLSLLENTEIDPTTFYQLILLKEVELAKKAKNDSGIEVCVCVCICVCVCAIGNAFYNAFYRLCDLYKIILLYYYDCYCIIFDRNMPNMLQV